MPFAISIRLHQPKAYTAIVSCAWVPTIRGHKARCLSVMVACAHCSTLDSSWQDRQCSAVIVSLTRLCDLTLGHVLSRSSRAKNPHRMLLDWRRSGNSTCDTKDPHVRKASLKIRCVSSHP